MKNLPITASLGLVQKSAVQTVHLNEATKCMVLRLMIEKLGPISNGLSRLRA